jgi:hypothetical protein
MKLYNMYVAGVDGAFIAPGQQMWLMRARERERENTEQKELCNTQAAASLRVNFNPTTFPPFGIHRFPPKKKYQQKVA